MAKCLLTDARVFTAINPLAATAGKPIPGNVESSQHISPGRGVLGKS
jgi:hypothetical protein